MSSMGEKEIVAAFVESLNRVSNKELFQMLSPRCKQAREDMERLGDALKMNNVAENIRIAISTLYRDFMHILEESKPTHTYIIYIYIYIYIERERERERDTL